MVTFMQCTSEFDPYLGFSLKSFFNISSRAKSAADEFSVFVCLKKFLLSSSLLKDTFIGYRILVQWIYFIQIKRYMSPYPLFAEWFLIRYLL